VDIAACVREGIDYRLINAAFMMAFRQEYMYWSIPTWYNDK